MRLIDADAFEKFIKEKYKDGESTDDIKDQFLFDLSYQPTAYDPEAAVAELEKEYNNIPLSYERNYEDGFSDGLSDGLLKAIEIVRKGGVE